MHAPVSVAKSSTASGLSAQPEGDRVGQREPAFGVGVVDLDGLAVHRTKHVAELVRLARRHVLGAGRERVHLDGQLLLGGGDRAAITAAAPDMSIFMSTIAFVRLQRQAARVERDALADEHDPPPRACRGGFQVR